MNKAVLKVHHPNFKFWKDELWLLKLGIKSLIKSWEPRKYILQFGVISHVMEIKKFVQGHTSSELTKNASLFLLLHYQPEKESFCELFRRIKLTR